MIELNRIYNRDCLEGMKEIPDKSVDMVLCDLPYGSTSNKWDVIIPFEDLWFAYDRVCKDNAAIVMTASQPFTSMLIMSNLKMFRHEWIWLKNQGSNFANTIREPFKEHEEILVFSKGKWTYNPQMQERAESGKGRVQYNVKFTSKSSNYRDFEDRNINKKSDLRVPSSWQRFNRETGLHPTQKPVDLFRYLIRTYSNPGDTILDNCMGSGTTAVAAVLEKRKFIGFETDATYFEKANERLRKLTGPFRIYGNIGV